ncbi:protein adenylyltransferase SelO [Seonamhaeicola marinus]|uniref:Protein nucleotidyltransferase YdiU n=1 Tax=Seonamhaeicola marinus TaxID=1912246 RepID=A0A5D0HEY3_9FLAO|nr:YdiU family protein [Seonamhaeicola marinus]TYA69913.1 YdiU family protein [Seonamhaeicola marinus]
MQLNIKDTFNKELPSDPILENSRRQVFEACFSYVSPKETSKPELLHVSPEMIENLGLSQNDAKTEEFLKVFTGNKVLPDTKPFAMCYGGHQFGNWAGQLGDGRAINLFEVEHNHKNWALQLKGAGETPYSRRADGLAVLRSSIREYLCSEAMFHLGVPTTRALSLALSGDQVMRDVMYDGNPAYEKGAIVCRTAESFLRFGNYQIFAARQDLKNLKVLVDYTIKQHFSHLGAPSKEVYLKFFKEVVNRTLEMIIHWQRVGFVHGVMNTDNLSILGLTIDYGPYGWLEGYDFGWTPNTTDRQNKRYRYGNQPNIGLWNLLQLANAIYPLIEDAEPLEAILNQYKTDFETGRLDMIRSKLGLKIKADTDASFILELEDVLHLTETDMTIFFRNLADFKKNDSSKGLEIIYKAFYKPDEVVGNIEKKWNDWFVKYAERLQQETRSDKERKDTMNQVNPKYVLRNYMAQLAIDDANKGNYELIDELFTMLKKPYDEQPKFEKWYAKRPEWARHKVGCSMLSCSS